MNFPIITVVTPNYNQVAYIEETIKSVLSQNYPNLEYIIIDGGSTDGSVEMINKYSDELSYWVSEPDSGMYDALNKGFERATGNILMYINSDDVLIAGSLHLIAKIFHKYPSTKWISGYRSWLNEYGEITEIKQNVHWSIIDYINGNYKWIQQESTVWSRDAWKQVGGLFNTNYKYAGDLELWSRFFLLCNPIIVNFCIGAFRVRNLQISQVYLETYNNEAKEILEVLKSNTSKIILKKAFKYNLILRIKSFLIKSIVFNHAILLNILDKLLLDIRGRDERIVFSNNSWVKQISTDPSLYKL